MKKIAYFIFFIVIIFICYNIHIKIKQKQILEKSHSIVPDLPLQGIGKGRGEFSVRNLSKNKKTIIVIFSINCDHCIYQINKIKENKQHFENISVVLISSDSIDNLERFSKNDSYLINNIYYSSLQNIADYFGLKPTPSIYIYNENSKLVKSFNGETKINSIVKYIM